MFLIIAPSASRRLQDLNSGSSSTLLDFATRPGIWSFGLSSRYSCRNKSSNKSRNNYQRRPNGSFTKPVRPIFHAISEGCLLYCSAGADEPSPSTPEDIYRRPFSKSIKALLACAYHADRHITEAISILEHVIAVFQLNLFVATWDRSNPQNIKQRICW
jgi:hypothetical protein